MLSRPLLPEAKILDPSSSTETDAFAHVGARDVLVVAYYFPPMGLSGVQRISKFVKYLPRFGWNPTVITTEPKGYFAYDQSLLDELDVPGVSVLRTRTFDPTSVVGKREKVSLPGERFRRLTSILSSTLLVPDNKVGWLLEIPRIIGRLENRPSAVLATAPPYTGLLLGNRLAREYDVPLLVDFRDDWVGNPRHIYPTPLHRALHRRMERSVIRQAAAVTTINGYIAAALTERNEDLLDSKNVSIIPQGYDPDDFAGESEVTYPRQCEFLYSGTFYGAQQPDTFLSGLYEFLQRRPEHRPFVRATFVGALPDRVREVVQYLGLEDRVEATGYLNHDETCRRLRGADVLWMTVGRQEGGEQISTGKLYEYLGTKKPVLGLVPRGAAHDTLASYSAGTVVDPDDVMSVVSAMESFFVAWQQGNLAVASEEEVLPYDRHYLTGRLADYLDAITGASKSIE